MQEFQTEISNGRMNIKQGSGGAAADADESYI